MLLCDFDNFWLLDGCNDEKFANFAIKEAYGVFMFDWNRQTKLQFVQIGHSQRENVIVGLHGDRVTPYQ